RQEDDPRGGRGDWAEQHELVLRPSRIASVNNACGVDALEMLHEPCLVILLTCRRVEQRLALLGAFDKRKANHRGAVLLHLFPLWVAKWLLSLQDYVARDLEEQGNIALRHSGPRPLLRPPLEAFHAQLLDLFVLAHLRMPA